MKRSILFALLSGSLLACQLPLQMATDVQVVNLKAEPVSTPTEIQVSQNQGAKIHLNFQYGPETQVGDFKTQQLCTVDDLKSFRIYLINGNSNPLAIFPVEISANVLPDSSTYYPVNKTTANSGPLTQNITLSNINAGSYYLAVAAYDDLGGEGNNITSLMSSKTINGEPVVVSNGGGAPFAPGRVEIGVAELGFPILYGTDPTLTVNLTLGAPCL